MADDPDAPSYVAEAITCLACEQREAGAHSAREDAGDSPQHGVYWMVAKR